jgi:hypothetical protein
MKMLPCSGRVRYFALTDTRYVKALKIRRCVQHDSFFGHHRSISTHYGCRRRFAVVNPSVLDGRRGG